MQLLKQSTAATTLVGPILDSTGASYTGAVIGDLNITKNGTTAAMAAAASLTHDHNGYYFLVFTTGNTDTLGRFDVRANVDGGGQTGQAGALRLAVARALVALDESHRRKLRDLGLLTRDARAVERKKPGRPKARKRFQFSKR